MPMPMSLCGACAHVLRRPFRPQTRIPVIQVENLLASCRAEVERAKKDCSRLRSQIVETERERDTARAEQVSAASLPHARDCPEWPRPFPPSAQEKLREAEHAMQLRVEQLQQRLSDGAPLETHETERRLQVAPPASLTPPASSISCMPRRPAERACSRTSALPVGDAPELALCRGGGAEGAAGGSDAPRGVEVRSRSRVHRKPAPGHCLVWSDDADAPSQTPPFSALMGEVEAVSKAFEQLQEQNVRLLQTIQDKEEAATKLVAERLRADQSMKLLKAERQGLDEKLAAAERLAEKERDLRSSLEMVLKQSKQARRSLDPHARRVALAPHPPAPTRLLLAARRGRRRRRSCAQLWASANNGSARWRRRSAARSIWRRSSKKLRRRRPARRSARLSRRRRSPPRPPR